MSYKDEWLMIEANDDIDEDFHREPTEEFLFYRAVANGDVETVRRNCEQARFEDQEGVGVLSRNPVTNMKYHFVVTTAMITRMCRQYGMELEQAFRLSDFYIRQLDDIHTESEVCRLHDEMVMDYTERMRKYRHSNANSKHINACREYIYSHIKERITIEDLADALGVSASYLSRLFKKETGVSVSAYIRDRKIDMAKKPAAVQRRLDDRHCQPAGLFFPEPFYPAIQGIGGHDPQKIPGQILYGGVEHRVGTRRPDAGRMRQAARRAG